MSDFLDNYGVRDARREKIVRSILIGAVALAVVGGALWFFLRNYKEEGRVREFLALLDRKDYRTAYAMWGCTEATPCRDYAFDKFLQDWGPSSDASAGVERKSVKSCETGIIQALQIKGQEVLIYIDRASLDIGFSPWPVCRPRIQL